MTKLVAEIGEYEICEHGGKFKVYDAVSCVAVLNKLEDAIKNAQYRAGPDAQLVMVA